MKSYFLVVLIVDLMFLLVGCDKQQAKTNTAKPEQQNLAGQDFSDVVKQYQKNAENGIALDEYNLGVCYYNGRGIFQDYKEAAEWFGKAANQGMPNAQSALGYCFQNGLGVPQDLAEAVEWYRKAAEQGVSFAQLKLGTCFAGGIGVPQNYVEAAKWYHKAAEQGDAWGQMMLGACYDEGGKGVASNPAEAVKWYRKAAAQGNPLAQYYLGSCYFNGRGISKDFDEAINWWSKAGNQGYADAQLQLGVFYGGTNSTPKNYTEVVKWCAKAAEQGNPLAEMMLGACYEEGDGVVKDYVEAYKWFNLASALGNEDAKKFLSAIEQQMTPDQIAEAQKRSAAFVPRTETPNLNSNSLNPYFAPKASGTGFLITEDGYFITCAHVVEGAVQVRLLTSAGLIDAKAVQVDAANDLALLKADGKFSPLPISSSRSAQLGGTVATVGFPDIGLQGFAPKLAKGEIASLSGAVDDPRYFQISVPVQPGNSGGALVDERGNVIGIVSAKLDASVALAASGALPENVNYAVKSSLLLSFLESVPEVSAKLKSPNTADEKFEDVVKSAQAAAVLVLVY